MFTEIAPDVYSVAHRFVEGKNGIIIGTRGALAIDTCNYPDEGQAMTDFIRSKGWQPDRLALTHGHGDHILGGAAFADAEIFAHAATPEVIRKQLPGWAERSGESIAQVEARTIWPTVTFTDELRIDLGGKHLQFFPTPGHSKDGVCIYLEEHRALFAGDTVSTGIVSAFGDGDSREMEASLRKLTEMDIEILVPGHGPVLRGANRVRTWLEWLISYLSSVRAFVGDALRPGVDSEAVADVIDYQEFIGARLPIDKHGMPRRHRNAVEKIIEEELDRKDASR
ncbi:MAG: MBL fold metallo-hydrolase [Candidatus Poribacteria bacterium]|nr:MBL fold metallo-hydrolase [Candidatus Poribacteria bacterium]